MARRIPTYAYDPRVRYSQWMPENAHLPASNGHGATWRKAVSSASKVEEVDTAFVFKSDKQKRAEAFAAMRAAPELREAMGWRRHAARNDWALRGVPMQEKKDGDKPPEQKPPEQEVLDSVYIDGLTDLAKEMKGLSPSEAKVLGGATTAAVGYLQGRAFRSIRVVRSVVVISLVVHFGPDYSRAACRSVEYHKIHMSGQMTALFQWLMERMP